MTVRQSVALGVAAVGLQEVISTAVPDDPGRRRLLARLEPTVLPSAAHVLALLVGVALLVLVPKLARGTRAAVPLAIAGLATLAVLNLAKALAIEEAALALTLAVALARSRHAFPVGARNRPRSALVVAAVTAWVLTYCAVLVRPLVHGRAESIHAALHRTIGHVLHASLAPARTSGFWTALIELLIASAAVITLLALRSLLRPAAMSSGHTDDEFRSARDAVERHGEDSLSPFILRPDKSFHFDGDGVLAYRVIGETAVISGDPVAPAGEAQRVLESFRERARSRGWRVAVWGASSCHLDAYRALRMRAVCVGEEAFVDPSGFTLEGRRVRKLRQSVHRIERRGWRIAVYEGRELDEQRKADVDALEAQWRLSKRRLHGFAMGMGPYDSLLRPNDLYLLAYSPEGDLRAVMRFMSHCARLSLDAMHRLSDTPNGLNEALVCRAIEAAQERGVPEISLNYAGLGHLARSSRTGKRRPLNRLVLRVLRRRFQMERLVRFNEKFHPEWRPRYLVYESRADLPRAAFRVLQAEGYVPEPRPPRIARGVPLARGVRASPRADAAS